MQQATRGNTTGAYKTGLSLPADLVARARVAAIARHRGNFSGYISHLIRRDLDEEEPKRQAALARLSPEERRLLGYGEPLSASTEGT